MNGGFQYFIAVNSNGRGPVRTGESRRDLARKDLASLPGGKIVGLLMEQARALLAQDRMVTA
jgi:hypothetical protein